MNAEKERGTNRGVFPVKDDLWNVFSFLRCGAFTPVLTANRYYAILIHTSKENKKADMNVFQTNKTRQSIIKGLLLLITS